MAATLMTYLNRWAWLLALQAISRLYRYARRWQQPELRDGDYLHSGGLDEP